MSPPQVCGLEMKLWDVPNSSDHFLKEKKRASVVVVSVAPGTGKAEAGGLLEPGSLGSVQNIQ